MISALLEKMRQTSQAATPGTWVRSGYGYQILTGDGWSTICRFDGIYGGGRYKDYRLAVTEDGRGPQDDTCNSDHVATCSPANVTQVLDHVESLEAEVARLRAGMTALADLLLPVTITSEDGSWNYDGEVNAKAKCILIPFGLAGPLDVPPVSKRVA